MRVNRLLLSTCISLLMAFLPTAAAVAAANKCAAAKPNAASYTWNFQNEADNIFEDIQADAARAQYHAEQLQTFARDQQVSWQSQAIELDQVRSAVNDMGERLCRLETIRRSVAPWQQRTIDRIAPAVRLMADNAQDAIVFGNNNQHILWSPTYRKYAANLYTEARQLNHTAEHAVEFAKVNTEYRELRKDLGTKSSS